MTTILSSLYFGFVVLLLETSSAPGESAHKFLLHEGDTKVVSSAVKFSGSEVGLLYDTVIIERAFPR